MKFKRSATLISGLLAFSSSLYIAAATGDNLAPKVNLSNGATSLAASVAGANFNQGSYWPDTFPGSGAQSFSSGQSQTFSVSLPPGAQFTSRNVSIIPVGATQSGSMADTVSYTNTGSANGTGGQNNTYDGSIGNGSIGYSGPNGFAYPSVGFGTNGCVSGAQTDCASSSGTAPPGGIPWGFANGSGEGYVFIKSYTPSGYSLNGIRGCDGSANWAWGWSQQGSYPIQGGALNIVNAGALNGWNPLYYGTTDEVYGAQPHTWCIEYGGGLGGNTWVQQYSLGTTTNSNQIYGISALGVEENLSTWFPGPWTFNGWAGDNDGSYVGSADGGTDLNMTTTGTYNASWSSTFYQDQITSYLNGSSQYLGGSSGSSSTLSWANPPIQNGLNTISTGYNGSGSPIAVASWGWNQPAPVVTLSSSSSGSVITANLNFVPQDGVVTLTSSDGSPSQTCVVAQSNGVSCSFSVNGTSPTAITYTATYTPTNGGGDQSYSSLQLPPYTPPSFQTVLPVPTLSVNKPTLPLGGVATITETATNAQITFPSSGTVELEIATDPNFSNVVATQSASSPPSGNQISVSVPVSSSTATTATYYGELLWNGQTQVSNPTSISVTWLPVVLQVVPYLDSGFTQPVPKTTSGIYQVPSGTPVYLQVQTLMNGTPYTWSTLPASSSVAINGGPPNCSSLSPNSSGQDGTWDCTITSSTQTGLVNYTATLTGGTPSSITSNTVPIQWTFTAPKGLPA